MIRKGVYRHFKGKDYEVLGVFTHSETREKFVAYRGLFGKKEEWCRPLSMFAGRVVNGDESVQRFTFIRESPITVSLDELEVEMLDVYISSHIAALKNLNIETSDQVKAKVIRSSCDDAIKTGQSILKKIRRGSNE